MAQNNDRQFWTEKLSGKGHLGNDPKLITNSNSKIAIAVVNVAASARTNDRNGNPIDRTTWRSLKFFGRAAESVMHDLKKGDYIFYEGRVNPTSYENKNGDIVDTEEILVDNVSKGLSHPDAGNGGSRSGGSSASRSGGASRSRRAPEPEEDYEDNLDEDLEGLEDEPPRSRSRSRSSNASGGRSRSRSRSEVEVDDDIDGYTDEALF